MGEMNLMNYETLSDRISNLVRRYQFTGGHRRTELFTEFLVTGYRQTTLSSVTQTLMENVIYAKVCLGMIITLYDDLADHPDLRKPELLKKLYQFNLSERPQCLDVMTNDLTLYELAYYLFDELHETLSSLPRFADYKDILSFDIKQVFLANEYAELMSTHAIVRNLSESKLYGPYNMGMIAAGMIDLMASPDFEKSYTGIVREILIDGQRLGRIGNLLTTFSRELNEGDVTNEILLYPDGVNSGKSELEYEFNKILFRLKKKSVPGVHIEQYARGLCDLFTLHKDMEGII